MWLAKFRLFGPDHWGTLLVVAMAGILVARRAKLGKTAYWLGWTLVLAMAADPWISAHQGRLSWQTTLPFELCDAAAIACLLALWRNHQGAAEAAYFWGLTGTMQALLTPTMAYGFPDPEFLRFMIAHAAIVLAVVHLVAGGFAPREHAWRRVLLWTCFWAAGVAGINAALDANYMFLCRKPSGSLLDYFGPWPVYLFGAFLFACAMYRLLDEPYRRRRVNDPARVPPR